MPSNTGDFQLMSRSVNELLRYLGEFHGFLHGFVALVGFKRAYVEYACAARFSRKGNHNRLFGSLTSGLNGASGFSNRPLSWILANFRCSETAVLQVFLVPPRIFERSRASPGPTKNSVFPYILGRFAHPPLQKLTKVKLRLWLTNGYAIARLSFGSAIVMAFLKLSSSLNYPMRSL
jgi:hypothetical protein